MLENLQKLRKKAKLTQAQLAKLLDVSLITVKKWESKSEDPRTARDPSLTNLKKIARALNVRIDELL